MTAIANSHCTTRGDGHIVGGSHISHSGPCAERRIDNEKCPRRVLARKGFALLDGCPWSLHVALRAQIGTRRSANGSHGGPSTVNGPDTASKTLGARTGRRLDQTRR